MRRVMTVRLVLTVPGLLMIAALLPIAAGAADQDEPATGVMEDARAILEDPAYQTDLPLEAPAVRVGRRLGPFASALLYLLAALVLALILYWTLNEFLAGDRVEMGGPAGEAANGRSRDRLADPERLAEQGRFQEAVHTLLLIATRRLCDTFDVDPAPSSTSREIERLLPLDTDRRASFSALVREVELSLFGGRPVGATEFGRCLRHYRSLVAESGR